MIKVHDFSDQDLEEMLRKLPAIESDSSFQNGLRDQLLKATKINKGAGRAGKYRTWAAGLVAACLIISIFSLLFFNNRSENRLALTLFPATAANAAGAPGLSIGEGLEKYRNVNFVVRNNLVEGSREGKMIILKNDEMNDSQVLDLARRLKMVHPSIKDNYQNEPGIIQILSQDEELLVSKDQGSWVYIRQTDNTAKKIKAEVSKVQAVALQWLKDRAAFPREAYSVNTQLNEGFSVTTIRPKNQYGLTVFSAFPEIRIIENDQLEVMQVEYTWYETRSMESIQLLSYSEALKDLNAGAGTFTCEGAGVNPAGTAEIETAEDVYLLMYGLDYTPYYVPGVLFQGNFQEAGSNHKVPFTASIPLMNLHQANNAGNFELTGSLPRASAELPVLEERDISATIAIMPNLARFFNVNWYPTKDQGYAANEVGVHLIPGGGSGWIYKSDNFGQSRSQKPVSDLQARGIADKIVHEIPDLPGKIGDSITLVRSNGGDKWVFYPMLYNGIKVISPFAPDYASSIAVQLGSNGEVWSVQCLSPMIISNKKRNIITPEAAWNKLRKNQYSIGISGFDGLLAGERFAAISSNVDGVKLEYFLEDKKCKLVYVFEGKTHIGQKTLGFKAFVDAEQN